MIYLIRVFTERLIYIHFVTPYATRCIESGMPAKVLQNLLGHTDIRITLDTYCDVFQKYSMENLAVADSYMKSNNIAIV